MPRFGTLDVAPIAPDLPDLSAIAGPEWELPDAEFLQINWEVDDADVAGADAAVAAPVDPAVRLVLRLPLPGLAGRPVLDRPGAPRGARRHPAPWPVPRRGVRLGRRGHRPARALGLPGAARRRRRRPPPRPGALHRRARRAHRRRPRRAHGRRHQRQRPDDVRQPAPRAPARTRTRRSSCRSTPSTRSTRPTAAARRCRCPTRRRSAWPARCGSCRRSSASRSAPTPTSCPCASRSTACKPAISSTKRVAQRRWPLTIAGRPTPT